MFLNYITFNNDFVVKNNFIFREIDVIFNQSDQTFTIHFNNDIDPRSIDNKNFKFKLRNKRFKIMSSKLYGKRKIKVRVSNWNKTPILINKEDLAQLEYKIKRIKDVSERVIYRPVKISGYQFRELFVQEVFPNKEIDSSLSFILKDKPLKASKINNHYEIHQYWLNSPLMERRAY